ncbi:holo-ACP synthase [Lactobacillus sp. DCY120]|uniref:Holo-[acyl-carrier-protein] synthase n=1 Tax=Bombilactobacillus apium TaxID=2675299 RepID=A0A850R666_9LACO|nr:holo-ACP synthase [Bombilactobacillus apium]NVY96327.1 holo-ACP synthase [Bombilactobacillus apium]
MIAGLGIDIAEISRVWQAFKRTPRFLEKVLTPAERKVWEQYPTDSSRQKEFLAGRFSAKEAFTKALGTGIGPVGFQEITILNDVRGRPYIQQQVYSGTVWISISHTAAVVMTEVILEDQR